MVVFVNRAKVISIAVGDMALLLSSVRSSDSGVYTCEAQMVNSDYISSTMLTFTVGE